MSINFNTEPYFDDYSKENKFYKILFKPGYAVQARELNQIQSILQNQIEVHGKHIFKEGSMVIPGNSSVDNKASYVILQGTGLITNYIGEKITGATSGVSAQIIYATNADGIDAPTLFVKYTGSGTDNVTKVFANGENLLNSSSTVIGVTALADATGVGSIASVESGFYFIKNAFVYVTAQTIILDKYSSTPSYKIGLQAIESLVTAGDDEALLDNAQGSPNHSAPGADRYSIDLVLTKKNIDTATAGSFIVGESYTIVSVGTTDFTDIGATDNIIGLTFTATGVGTGTGTATINEEDFIQLIVLSAGAVQQKIQTSSYSIIEQTLARRTYDESGDYTVRNFQMDLREYRNNFRGDWTAYTNYLAGDVVSNGGNFYRCRKDGTSNNVAPTVTVGSTTVGTTAVVWTLEKNPFYNRGVNDVVVGESLLTQNENKAKLSVGLEPGKAYVRGYEIEKLAVSYIPVEKAREFTQSSNVTIPATVGNYVVVTNINSLPDITAFPVVELYDSLTAIAGTSEGNLVGTARIRGIEFNNDTAPGLQTTKYKVSLFNIKMITGKNFNTDVKQMFIDNGGVDVNFSADISPVLTRLSGSITASGINVTGNGSLFLTELKVGDWIQSNDTVDQVATITTNTTLTVANGLTLTGEVYYKIQTKIYEPENESLIFPLIHPYIKSVRDDNGNNVTSYTASTQFTETSSALGVVTITVTGNDAFASPADADNYLVLNNVTGLISIPTSVAYGSGTQQIVISGLVPTNEYVVIAAINRSGITTEKTKTLNTAVLTFTDKNVVGNSVIQLAKADGLRLLEVLMDTGTFAVPTGVYSTDITSKYTFDNGQRTTHYDLCALTLNQGQVAPAAPIQVTFEYFDHVGTGDHFTVNSYLSTVSYEEIPPYGDIPLAFAFDFRPKINDAGTAFSTTLVPKRGIDIQCDFQHYYGRKDKIVLNQTGSFFSVTGTSSDNPKDPPDSSTGMLLYKLELNPYTYNTGEVKVQSIDNKRFTMRDIGKLEKRIDNIEYYTSLSMLEQHAQSLEIQDETGLNRFKNGFIVDNFTGHNIGEVGSADYSCSIDMGAGEMRPTFYTDNVNLIEQNTSSTQRAASGYQVTGDLITLPYTEVELVKQMDASRVENINPFAIFTFIGQAELNPASDEWFETKRLPDIVTNVEGNFDSIKFTAERSGVLGTVWNAWQTQWTGAPVSAGRQTIVADQRGGFGSTVSAGTINAMFGNGPRANGWAHRVVVAETLATTSGQARTGVRGTVVAKIDTEITDDRTVSKAVIPYIRARALMFVVRGLKPNTVFTPFFDSVKVGGFTQPSSQITVARNTRFDSEVRAGGDSSEAARLVNGNAESALDRGDIIFVSKRGATTYTKETSPATAVLALASNPLNGTTTILNVVNVKGAFASGDTVTGSISAATSIISISPAIKALGDTIVSSAAGDVVGIFNIPNTNANRFRAGVREFKLSDDVDDAAAKRTSYVNKLYKAEGILETKQYSVTATRNGEIRSEAVNENRTVTQTSQRVISDTGWYDPLAQTFMVASPGGAFVTSVDVFFATKDTSIPARMEIREVVNGYPGKVILPFSEVVLTPDKVNISTTLVKTSAGETYPSPIATNFKFPSPVYLNDKTEYCIVLLSDSNGYKVWISQLGDISVVQNKVISEQPYAGVLFKSQNGSTWSADQSQDLMFKINKAKFNENTIGEVEFMNAAISSINLRSDPFYVVSGTNYVRVSHENHGFHVGSTVVLSGAATNVGGIPFAQFNASFTIVAVDHDTYVIQTSSNATFTGSYGGDTIIATENIEYNVIQPIVQQQVFPDTDISHTVRTTTGQSVNGSEVPGLFSSYIPVSINENNTLDTVRMIGTTATEAAYPVAGKSFKLRSRMITSNPNISPVIDIARLSLITVQDRINWPTESNTNFAALDTRNIVTSSTVVGITTGTLASRFTTTDTATKTAFLSVNLGTYITTTGFATAGNNGKFLVTAIPDDGSYIEVLATLTTVAAGASITMNSLERFVDEIAPVGSSSVAKYVSKKINLANPGTFLKVRFAADVEQLANIDLYYKLQPANETVDFNKMIYTKATPIKSAVPSDNGVFSDVEYEIKDLPEFTAVQVKLVINSTGGADIVRTKDLLIIGCA